MKVQRFFIPANLLYISQLVGCASAPEQLYTLEAASAINRAPLHLERPYVLVGPVQLPELIDRPQLVIRNGEYSIDINEQQRWATPLKESLPRVIAAELNLRILKENFIASSPNMVSSPSARLLIEIISFDLSPSGASIVAHWSYRPTDKHLKPIERQSQAKAVVKTANYLEYVDAARRAVQLLANDIAKKLNNK
jgi:uncharacterized protein